MAEAAAPPPPRPSRQRAPAAAAPREGRGGGRSGRGGDSSSGGGRTERGRGGGGGGGGGRAGRGRNPRGSGRGEGRGRGGGGRAASTASANASSAAPRENSSSTSERHPSEPPPVRGAGDGDDGGSGRGRGGGRGRGLGAAGRTAGRGGGRNSRDGADAGGSDGGNDDRHPEGGRLGSADGGRGPRGGRDTRRQQGRGDGGGRGRGAPSKGRGYENPSKKAPGEAVPNEQQQERQNPSRKKGESEATNAQTTEGVSKQKTVKKSSTSEQNQLACTKGADAPKGGTKTNQKQSAEVGIKSADKNPPKSKQGSKAIASPSSSGVPPNQPQQTSDIYYGKGSTITILHVAEKPSIAQAITKGLAPSSASVDGYKSALPVQEFHTSGGGGSPHAFPKAPHATQCLHRVTSVAGHVFSTDFPPQFQSWDSVDPAELFEAPVERKPTKGSVVKHLQDHARGVDFIVLWMDCDKEGENINFEVLGCCMHLMKGAGTSSGGNYDRVYRAYFSAINPSDIQKAYHALGKPDQNQALAVDARQELDLKIGVAFSRFQTRYFQGRYGDLDSSVLSYGPCQTPTLGFCVQRHIDIETFKPEPYWVLELGIIKRGRTLRALWSSGRSFNRGRVETLLETAKDGALVVVKSVVTKEKKQGRPIPLNTVALLKACSKSLGIGPHACMQAAERLYLSGYLSYPRTESSSYPKSFDIVGTLKQQSTDGRWGAYVRRLLQEGPTNSRGGVDMGDHPPITPCRSAGAHELSGDMARVFDLVVRHFIASVSQDAVWMSTRVDFSIDALGEKGGFTLQGKQLVSPGFLEVLLHKEYNEDADRIGQAEEDENEEEREIPEFSVGETIPLINSSAASSGAKVTVATGVQTRANLEIKEKKTTPPLPLSESELITLMEKNGIGTDASIPTHIENIQKRNYVTLESGRRLHPSKLGLVLVQGYHQIDSSLVLPRVRSDIEDQCNQIAKGTASKDAVVRKALVLFRGKFDLFVASIGKMDLLFGASFSKLEDIGKPFTRCGLTRRYLQFIPGPPQRLYNKWTETVYPLPEGGIVKQWTGRTCSVEGCNFELCLYSVGQPPRTFPLCPRCFNDPDWALDADDLPEDPVDREDEGKERVIRRTVAGRALTLECPLPDHHPSVAELTVSPDPDSDGVLMMDPHFGPKWRLVSTRDPTIVHFPPSVEKVTVLDKLDDVLGVHLVQVEFKAEQSPLPDKKAKHVCCFANDEALQGVVRVYRGSERTKASFRGGRGRGRGGRGGRGGGRAGGRGRR